GVRSFSRLPLCLGPVGGETPEHRIGLGAFRQCRQPPDFEASARANEGGGAGIADAVARGEIGEEAPAVIERIGLGIAEALLERLILVKVEIARERRRAVALDLVGEAIILVV